MKNILIVIGLCVGALLVVGGILTMTFAPATPRSGATIVPVLQGGTGKSTLTASQLLYGNGGQALFSVATSSQALSVAFSTTGTFGAEVGGSAGTISSITQPSLTYSTSTAWTGTTTIYLQNVNVAETINGIKCRTDVGTLNFQTFYGAATTTMYNASTSVNFNTYTSNNTPAVGNTLGINIGTPATSPTTITCTYKFTI